MYVFCEKKVIMLIQDIDITIRNKKGYEMNNEKSNNKLIVNFLKDINYLFANSDDISVDVENLDHQSKILIDRYVSYSLDLKKLVVYLYLENMRTWNISVVDDGIIKEIQRNLRIDDSVLEQIDKKDYLFNDDLGFNPFIVNMLGTLIKKIECETNEPLIRKSNLVEFSELLKSDNKGRFQISNFMKVLGNKESIDNLSKLDKEVRDNFIPYVIWKLRENPEGNYGLIRKKRIITYLNLTIDNNRENIYKEEWLDVLKGMLKNNHVDYYNIKGWKDNFISLIEIVPGFDVSDIEKIKNKIKEIKIIKSEKDVNEEEVKIEIKAEKYLNKIELLNTKNLNGMNKYLINCEIENIKTAYEKNEISKDEMVIKIMQEYLNERGFKKFTKEAIDINIEFKGEWPKGEGIVFKFIVEKKHKEAVIEMIEATTNPKDKEREDEIEKIIDKIKMKNDIKIKAPEVKRPRKF